MKISYFRQIPYLFEIYWLFFFLKWMLAVFSFLFVIFFINQLLFLGQTLLPLNFSLLQILGLALASMPFILDWVFPISVFLGLFWMLSTVISHKELIAWLSMGISPSIIGIYLVVLVFLSSFTYLILNDWAEIGCYNLQKFIIEKWQEKVPNSWIKEGKTRSVGNIGIWSKGKKEGNKVYLIQKSERSERDFLILNGKVNAEEREDRLRLQDVFFYSASSKDLNAYDLGRSDFLTVNWKALSTFLSEHRESEPVSFIGLTKNILKADTFKDRYTLKAWKYSWTVKITTFFSGFFLGILSIILVWFKSLEGQDFYPFWVGIFWVFLYSGLALFSRIFFLIYWRYQPFWVLWIPIIGVFSFILVLLSTRFKSEN